MVASADYLDVQIAELTKQKQEKIKILEECQKSNKGFKIAGLATLGVSAIGVGVNIGEAIKIKGQKSDIADKEKQLDELDSKISSTKILIVENNTCGPSECQGDGDTAAVTLNGAGPVCINNVWAVKSCDDGFSGRLKKCKRKGVEIEYYDACTKDAAFNTCGSAECDESTRTSKEAELNGAGALCVDKKWTVQTCNQGYIGEKKQCTREGTSYDFYFKCEPEASFQSCGSANCTGEEAAAMETLHGKPAICINNNWAVQSCDDGYSGIEQQCNRNGVLVKYYHQCTEQSGRNTCGSSNCTGDGSAEATILNGSLPICFGGLWHVRVCNEGYSGKITTCTRDGVTYSYYANGCSKVSVPDGVSVKDLGNGQYSITIDNGDDTEGEGGSHTYIFNDQGGVKEVVLDGESGEHKVVTINGDIYVYKDKVYVYKGIEDDLEILQDGRDGQDGRNGRNGGNNGRGGKMPNDININVNGDPYTFTFASSNCSDDDFKVQVSSDKESVATVVLTEKTATITPVGVGTAIITVSLQCGDETPIVSQHTVTVTEEELNIEGDVENNRVTVKGNINFVGSSTDLYIDGKDECAGTLTIEASSKNEKIAKVVVDNENHKVTVQRVGTGSTNIEGNVKCDGIRIDSFKFPVTFKDNGGSIDIDAGESGDGKLVVSMDGLSGNGIDSSYSAKLVSEKIINPCEYDRKGVSFNDLMNGYSCKDVNGMHVWSFIYKNSALTKDEKQAIDDLESRGYGVSSNTQDKNSSAWRIERCPATQYFVVNGIAQGSCQIERDGSFRSGFRIPKNSCQSGCVSELIFDYRFLTGDKTKKNGKDGRTFSDNTRKACMKNFESALKICRKYCEEEFTINVKTKQSGVVVDDTQCRLNAYGIDMDGYCRCNPVDGYTYEAGLYKQNEGDDAILKR